jgi:hypothetical protein
MGNRVMYIGNLNCVFQNSKEKKGFFDFWKEYTNQVFKSNIFVKPNEELGYLFSSVNLKYVANEPVIYGKFVKTTTLDVYQELEKGVLKGVNKHYPTAPSSLFVYLVKNHILLYLPEQKGSPAIRQFVSYFRKRVDDERDNFFNGLREIKSYRQMRLEYPASDISYTGLISTMRLHEIFLDTETISDFHIRTRVQNSNILTGGFIGGMNTVLVTMNAKKSDTKISRINSTHGAEKIINEISENGSAEFNFQAKLKNANNTKKRVSNDDVKVETMVDFDLQESIVTNVNKMLEAFKKLIDKKEIAKISQTTADDVINNLFSSEK